MTEARFCMDCRWAVFVWGKPVVCKRPEVDATRPVRSTGYLVDGRIGDDRALPVTCAGARERTELCGLGGRYWEARVPWSDFLRRKLRWLGRAA